MLSLWGRQLVGFPIRQMVVIIIIRLAEPMSFTLIFPYVYYMVRDFHVAPTEAQISKYTGFLASVFAFCQFLFAVKWGILADRIGRKPVLLGCVVGTGMCMVLFGFSKYYWMAFIARALMGSLNGNVAVLRTVIGESVTEKRHQPLAFLIMPLGFNLGSVLGPMIGGYFTNPGKTSPYIKLLSDKFPYALLNIIVAINCLILAVIGFLFLRESHPKFKTRRDVGVDLGDALLRQFGVESPVRPWNKLDEEDRIQSDSPSETSPLLPSSEDEDEDEDEENSEEEYHPEDTIANNIIRTYSHDEIDSCIDDSLSYHVDYSNAFTSEVIRVIAGNALMATHTVIYNEFLPVFLAGKFDADRLQFPFKIVGGLSWSSDSIGTLLSSTGILGMVVVLAVFPVITDRLGIIGSYRLLVLIFPIVYSLVPFAIFTVPGYSQLPSWVAPIYCYMLTLGKLLAMLMGMPQITLLNHRAAAPHHRAYVNSVTLQVLSLIRAIGPTVFGYVMSFGEKHEIGWFVWWLLAAVAGIGWIQSFMIEEYED